MIVRDEDLMDKYSNLLSDWMKSLFRLAKASGAGMESNYE
jgi:hypothetical protein